MSAVHTTLIASPSSSLPPSISPSRLRDRCGFTLYLSFSPAFPNIPAKGELGPSAGNLPRRRKRSSVVSIDLAPAPAPVDTRMDYFA